MSSGIPPELYLGTQESPKIANWDAITDQTIAQYESDGYVAISNAFSAKEVEDARAGIFDIATGRVKGPDVVFEVSARDRLDQLSPEERLDHVRRPMDFFDYEPRLKAMSEKPPLLDLVRRVMGAEPELYQHMGLLKPPGGREKPWHQDNAYYDLKPETPVVGVWIALDDVSAANGCMHLVPGGHKIGAIPHFKRRDWQICDTEFLNKPCVTVSLKAGGCMIFNGMLPHGTPYNGTNQRRRALQFHFIPKGAVFADPEVRLQRFGSEGKDVTC